ncbi:MAG: apolipoprotein N-acyltransferase [Aquificaceae bacterium]|nr:apolipoprotein N-acyltransferase [Aquificaceae bacterium]MDW8433871.1 apolipoprotein N-acyltransferase [Aquificaceae bacterium]
MRYSSYKPFLWKVVLASLTGFMLYLPFSKYELWFLVLPAFMLLFKFREGYFWFFSGFVFFSLSLRCASVAAVEFGEIPTVFFYLLFLPFVLFMSLYQFYAPLKLWRTFLKNQSWTLPFIYVLFEILRSHFPYGGFPWLVVGELSVYIPVIRDSLLYTQVYMLSLLLIATGFLLVEKRLKTLVVMWLLFTLFGVFAIEEKEKKLLEANSLRVALIQTAVPQGDKLDRESFRKHAPSILQMVEQAIAMNPELIALPESALHFLYSDEGDEYLIKLKELSYKAPILVGLVDIREGMKPYNSAYLLKDGYAVDYYDKVRLFPIGEYMPWPFGFLKELFPAISGLDYASGERQKPLQYKNMMIATPICFEVAYYGLVKKLSEEANLIAVLTNDGWFKDSDCTHQHYLWARVRALENGKYVLWVNNTGDTGSIDPYGRVLERMPYMKRGVSLHEVKLVP